MEKIGIVILNYLNYRDTIECVDSIKQMNYKIVGIVIVDNDSYNESYNILNKIYKEDKKICVVRAGKNYGYAKGNNIGIRIARRRFSADFVYVVNNDVIFKDPEYFEKLLCMHDDKTGVIGSEVQLKDGNMQSKFMAYISLSDVLNIYLRKWLVRKKKEIWLLGIPPLNERNKRQILHGCGLLFTPNYFKYYKGFYPKTFLYGEEKILFMMCQRRGLRQKYVKDTYIYHKTSQSSDMSFYNDANIVSEYAFQSYKYVVWWAFQNLFFEKLKGLHGIRIFPGKFKQSI